MAGRSWLRLLQELLEKPKVDAIHHWCNHAIKTIKAQYGDDVSIDLKRKALLKFGMNENIGQDIESNVAQLPSGVAAETDLNDNLIDTLSVTDASFNGGVYIEGHKIVDGKLIFVTQTVIADGQNKVLLDTPLVVATRAENADETLFGSIADIVYIYEDGDILGGVPTDSSLIHLIFNAVHRQSLKAGTAFSYEDYGLITNIYGDINKKTPATADILLRVRQLGDGFGRRPSGVKTKLIRSVSSTATNSLDYDFGPLFIVPKNSIVTINAISSSPGVSLSAGFNTLLAKVNNT